MVQSTPAGVGPPHKVMRPLRRDLVTVDRQDCPRELPPERWPGGTSLASYPSMDVCWCRPPTRFSRPRLQKAGRFPLLEPAHLPPGREVYGQLLAKPPFHEVPSCFRVRQTNIQGSPFNPSLGSPCVDRGFEGAAILTQLGTLSMARLAAASL